MVAEKPDLAVLLDQLNAHLGEVTPYKLAAVDPNAIAHIEKNAHYMPKRVYDQLIANVKHDGNLSSLPFCWQREDGIFVALSGNHRVDAAAAANIPQILVLYTDEQLSRPEQIAIQLSHNALVGLDNSAMLLELWHEMDDLSCKMYSGLDDNLLASIQPISLLLVKDERLRFEQIELQFLPHEVGQIDDICKALSKHTQFCCPVEMWDNFFAVLLDYKEVTGLHNSATAFMGMMAICREWLEHQSAGTGNTPT